MGLTVLIVATLSPWFRFRHRWDIQKAPVKVGIESMVKIYGMVMLAISMTPGLASASREVSGARGQVLKSKFLEGKVIFQDLTLAGDGDALEIMRC